MRYEFEFKLFSHWVSNLTRYFYKHSSIHLFVLCKSPSKHNTVNIQYSSTTGIKMASFFTGAQMVPWQTQLYCSKLVYFSFYIDVLGLMTPFLPFMVTAQDSSVQILSGYCIHFDESIIVFSFLLKKRSNESFSFFFAVSQLVSPLGFLFSNGGID